MFGWCLGLWLFVGVISALWFTWLEGSLQVRAIPFTVVFSLLGPVTALTVLVWWCDTRGSRYVWVRKE